MSISYPRAFPTVTGVARCDMHIRRSHIDNQSLSGFRNTTKLPRDRWTCVVTLPPLSLVQAQEWLGWLDSLDGVVGTFTMGSADFTSITGNAPNSTGRVAGASQTGSTITTDGWSTGVTDLFKAGDIISFGGQLKRVLVDTDSDGSGNATIEVAPPVYEAVADNALITTVSPTGTFRLMDGTYNVSSNENKIHTISFAVEEAPQA